MEASLDIIFWNLRKKNLSRNISQLIKKHNATFFAIAESHSTSEEIRQQLIELTDMAIHCCNLHENTSKTYLYTLEPQNSVDHIYSDIIGRTSLFRVRKPFFPTFLLALVHLPSKSNHSEKSLLIEASESASIIRKYADLEQNENILIAGDFNLNPFDDGMMATTGFHAVMDRQTALRTQRKIQGRSYPFFYAPMWSLLGDLTPGPVGTFYHASPDHIGSYWNTLDQFLLSPAMLRSASLKEIEILATDGVESFLRGNGRINARHYSDHLPIRLKMETNDGR